MRSTGHNLIGSATGCLIGGDATGNVIGVGAALGPFAANGGPTLTHALLPGSPALDGGAGCAATDERGAVRPVGPSCDIGAVEQAYVPTACGNGSLDGGETCDDGNVRDGDCCDHLCQLDGAGTLCADGNVCTDGLCDGAGTCVQSANTSPCTDGSVCTLGAETCTAGSCVPGPPRDCDDGAVCTGDTCDPVNGCQHDGISGPACDDVNFCTDADACVNGVCRGTPNSNPCDDNRYCTSSDACSAGVCRGTNNTLPCDDGDVCTVNDQCGSGSCQSGAPLVCAAACERCESDIGCTDAPRGDCRQTGFGGGASIQIDDKDNPKNDALKWSWTTPYGTFQEEVAIPTLYPDYELCVYDETAGNASLVWGGTAAIGLCGGKECWRTIAGGSSYKDKSGSADGLTQLRLSARSGKVKLAARAKGLGFTVPPMPFAKDPGVRVELRRRHGACWMSRFTIPQTHTGERFKARTN